MKKAVVILCKCPESGKTIGIRTEQAAPSVWAMTWAFAINEDSAGREGYADTVIDGSFGAAEEFNGCVYCKSQGFNLCPACGKVFCNVTIGGQLICPWCGEKELGERGTGPVNIRVGRDR